MNKRFLFFELMKVLVIALIGLVDDRLVWGEVTPCPLFDGTRYL